MFVVPVSIYFSGLYFLDRAYYLKHHDINYRNSGAFVYCEECHYEKWFSFLANIFLEAGSYWED